MWVGVHVCGGIGVGVGVGVNVGCVLVQDLQCNKDCQAASVCLCVSD